MHIFKRPFLCLIGLVCVGLGTALTIQIRSSPAWRANTGLARIHDGMEYREVSEILTELGGQEIPWFGQGEQERFWQFGEHHFIHVVWDVWTPLEDGNRSITEKYLFVRGNLSEKVLAWLRSMKPKTQH